MTASLAVAVGIVIGFVARGAWRDAGMETKVLWIRAWPGWLAWVNGVPPFLHVRWGHRLRE